MSVLSNLPATVDKDEWRRAIALMAAVDTHNEVSISSAIIREQHVLLSAKKYEKFLKDGTA